MPTRPIRIDPEPASEPAMSDYEPAARLIAKGPLAALLRHCQRLRSLETLVEPLLPPPMAGHVRVANYRQGELVLQTDSPAWTTRLRFETPALERALRSRLDGFRRLTVATRPGHDPIARTRGDERPSRRPRSISPRSAAALRALARSPRTDPRMARALERLAGLAADR